MENDIIVEVQGGSEIGVFFMPLSEVEEYLLMALGDDCAEELKFAFSNIYFEGNNFFWFELKDTWVRKNHKFGIRYFEEMNNTKYELVLTHPDCETIYRTLVSWHSAIETYPFLSRICSYSELTRQESLRALNIIGAKFDLVKKENGGVFDFYYWARDIFGTIGEYHRNVYKLGDVSFIENGSQFNLPLAVRMVV